MTVILLSSEENEFSLLCFHILIYCLTTGKSGAKTPLFLLKPVSSLPVAGGCPIRRDISKIQFFGFSLGNSLHLHGCGYLFSKCESIREC